MCTEICEDWLSPVKSRFKKHLPLSASAHSRSLSAHYASLSLTYPKVQVYMHPRRFLFSQVCGGLRVFSLLFVGYPSVRCCGSAYFRSHGRVVQVKRPFPPPPSPPPRLSLVSIFLPLFLLHVCVSLFLFLSSLQSFQALRNKKFGKCVDFVWSSEGSFAIKEETGRIRVHTNFVETFNFTPPFPVENIWGGALLALKASDDSFVCFYDWEACRYTTTCHVVPPPPPLLSLSVSVFFSFGVVSFASPFTARAFLYVLPPAF